jgi:transcription elongation factor GreA
MKTILTKEGMLKIQEELNFLLTIEKQRVISDLSDARESGPLEENTQYLVAKDEYEKLQLKISKLQNLLSSATVVDSNDLKTDKVMILSKVKVLNIINNKEMNFSIVPENEIDLKSLKISPNSPIGSGLMGRKVDEVCQIKTPAGTFEFKILEISI